MASRAMVPLLLLALTWVSSALGAPGWRGDGSGRFAGARPVSAWGDERGLCWSTPTPHWGNASPVAVGGKIIVTAEPASLLALDAASGKELWRHDTSRADVLSGEERAEAQKLLAGAAELETRLETSEKALHGMKRKLRRGGGADLLARVDALESEVNELREELAETDELRPPPPQEYIGYASSTPVTDGRAVYMVYGHGLAVSVGLDGTPRWARKVGPATRPMNGYDWGHAASPLLVAGTLILALGDVTGLDPESGDVRWRGPRYEDFGTPTVARAGSRELIVTPSGAVLDPRSGDALAADVGQLWHASPVAVGATVYFVGCTSKAESNRQEGCTAMAVALTESGRAISAKTLWRHMLPKGRYYASPVVHEGLIYAVTAGGRMSAHDASSGGLVWERVLPDSVTTKGRGVRGGLFYPSVTLAGSVLLVFDDAGHGYVVKTGRTFELVAHNALSDRMWASPTPVGARFFLRGYDRVYCVGER